ncbi:nitrilase-related carbon-nitrogen hydrolase [Pyxidicoccus sp. 3LFB2]
MRIPFAVLLVSLLGPLACGPELPEDDTVCRLSFEDRGDVRVFVVGHAFTLGDAASLEHFDVSFREDLRRIAPCLSAARPNLLLFPEDSGLVAWFTGQRAMLARGAGDTETAFNAMYAGWFKAVDEYRRRFPGISSARALTLALGDPAWRAMDTTFGGIAKRYGVWVITSANVPYVERRTDGDSVELFREPNAHGPAYVATGPDCYNAALLYGPDGALAGRIDKVYLTETEEEDLDLSPAPLDGVGVFSLPFGKVGAAISRDAFYAPFLQRMEDLDAELVTQPEAWSGWTVEDSQGGWLPDVILASGWTHTQKYRGFRHNATPMLVGNLFDLVFDGQTWITQKATPQQTPRAFVGSRALPGWLEVGPWTFPDPVEAEPALDLAGRQSRLREQGNALGPGSGDDREGRYARSVIGADLDLAGEEGRGPVVPVTPSGTGLASQAVAPVDLGDQTNPEGAFDMAGRLYVAFSDSRGGRPQVYVAVSDGAGFLPAKPVAAGEGRQLRPSVAASGEGRVVVAWQEERAGEKAQLYTSRSFDGGVTFSAPLRVEATEASQWEPDLAWLPGSSRVALVWTDFREGLAPKVRLALSEDGGVTWLPSVRVDPSNAVTDRHEGTQAQPTVTWGAKLPRLDPMSVPVVAWIDYRERDWEVYAAVASSGLARDFVAEQVSPEAAAETLASDPQLSPGTHGTVLLVWDDQRERRGHHTCEAHVAVQRGGPHCRCWPAARTTASSRAASVLRRPRLGRATRGVPGPVTGQERAHADAGPHGGEARPTVDVAARRHRRCGEPAHAASHGGGPARAVGGGALRG